MKRMLSLLIFILIVALIGWYVRSKRSDYLPAPVIAPATEIADAESDLVCDYFIDARLERERARSYELEQLRSILENTLTDPIVRRDAGLRYLWVNKNASLEADIECVAKAKGYEDCIAYCAEDSAIVVLKIFEVSHTDIGKIADVFVHLTGYSTNGLRVMGLDSSVEIP